MLCPDYCHLILNKTICAIVAYVISIHLKAILRWVIQFIGNIVSITLRFHLKLDGKK